MIGSMLKRLATQVGMVMVCFTVSTGVLSQPNAQPEVPTPVAPVEAKNLSHHLTGGEPVAVQPERHLSFPSPWDEEGPRSLDPAERFGLTIGLVAVVLGIVSPFALLMVLVVLHYRAKVRVAIIQRESIAKVVEAGQEVPLELFQGAKADPQRYMRNGYRNVGLGAGILIFLAAVAGWDVATLGGIPMAIGLAQLAIWKSSNSNSDN